MAIIWGTACYNNCNVTEKQESQAFLIDFALVVLAAGIIIGLSKLISQGNVTTHTIAKLEMVKKIAKIVLVFEIIGISLFSCCVCLDKCSS